MSHGELKLRDGEEEIIVNIAVRATMMYGRKLPAPLSLLLPMWKDTPMYERGIFLQKIVFVEYAPSWKIKKAIQSLDPDGWFDSEYDGDFFHGLFDSSSRMYVNGTFSRAEFGGRKHLREFLEGAEHGQRVVFANMNGTRKRLNRTKALPFMEIPVKNSLERWFVGAMCGADVKMVDGEPMMKMKNVCIPNLKKLGILYTGTTDNNILVSCFYFILFMSEMPDFFLSYWMSKIPHKGLSAMRNASMDAAMNWRVIRREKFVRGAFPFLFESRQNVRMGIRIEDLDKMISDRKFNFVDQRVKSKCERWAALSNISDEEKGETK